MGSAAFAFFTGFSGPPGSFRFNTVLFVLKGAFDNLSVSILLLLLLLVLVLALTSRVPSAGRPESGLWVGAVELGLLVLRVVLVVGLLELIVVLAVGLFVLKEGRMGREGLDGKVGGRTVVLVVLILLVVIPLVGLLVLVLFVVVLLILTVGGLLVVVVVVIVVDLLVVLVATGLLKRGLSFCMVASMLACVLLCFSFSATSFCCSVSYSITMVLQWC
jgi:hypothetical protein